MMTTLWPGKIRLETLIGGQIVSKSISAPIKINMGKHVDW